MNIFRKQAIMKKLIVALLLLGFISCGSEKEQETDTDLKKQFGWLTGTWEMQDSTRLIRETWESPRDHHMEAHTSIVNDSATVPIENLRLFHDGKDFIYEVRLFSHQEQEPVPFVINLRDSHSFQAINMANDFPKRITYRLIQPDSLYAFIDNGTDTSTQTMHFYYSRKK